MTPYRVFIFPNANIQDHLQGDDVRFIQDKTNIWAFLIALPWMVWNRLWLVALAYLALAVVLQLIGMLTNEQTLSLFALLTAFLIALEAPSLKAITWVRNGWQEVDLVMADSYFLFLLYENI